MIKIVCTICGNEEGFEAHLVDYGVGVNFSHNDGETEIQFTCNECDESSTIFL